MRMAKIEVGLPEAEAEAETEAARGSWLLSLRR
jgi:hypothetical protein